MSPERVEGDGAENSERWGDGTALERVEGGSAAPTNTVQWCYRTVDRQRRRWRITAPVCLCSN